MEMLTVEQFRIKAGKTRQYIYRLIKDEKIIAIIQDGHYLIKAVELSKYPQRLKTRGRKVSL